MKSVHHFLIFVLGAIQNGSEGLELPNSSTSIKTRRGFVSTGVATASAGLVSAFIPREKAIATDDILGMSSVKDMAPERQHLLQMIASEASETKVADAIARLEPLDPSKGKAAISNELGGTWKLIYSVNADAFSPLLNLPKPIRPTSFQLLGDDAAKAVGSGRVAQVLNFPIIPLSLVLSSGVVPVETNPTTLEIFPPFRFEAKLGGSKIQLVEAGSDAEFRALNARDDDAQAAPRNMYKQRYLETTGNIDDLRISEVVSGDPVIVGAVFIHQRVS